MSVKDQYYILNNGVKMPRIGFGTFRLDRQITKETIKEAVKAGYRLIDTAMMYTNEMEIGDALKELFEEGVVKREDIFVVTKLWNCYHRKEHVEEAIDKSLLDLGLDYVDLFLIHFPIPFKYQPLGEWKYKRGMDPNFDLGLEKKNLAEYGNDKIEKVPYIETYQAMEKLVENGKARCIGISNCTVAAVLDILSYAKIPPAVNQVENHIYLQQPKLRKFLEQHNILLQTYGTLGAHGGYAVKGPIILEDPVLLEVSKKIGRTPAQVCLKFAIDRGCSVLCRSTRKERMKENLELDFELGDDNIARLRQLDKNYRFNRPEDLFNFFVPTFD